MKPGRFGICLFIAIVPAFPNDNPDPAAVERGRKDFIASCGFCHGNDATGNRAPDLIRSALVNRDESGNLIGPVIKNGRPEKEMPGLPGSLGAADLRYGHVPALRASPSRSPANKVSNDYPLAKLLTGDAAQGKTYFDGAGGCAGCHSPTGDLAGVAKKYSPDRTCNRDSSIRARRASRPSPCEPRVRRTVRGHAAAPRRVRSRR